MVAIARPSHFGMACVALLACAATPAMAQDGGRFSAAITGGTLGIGPEIGYRFNENFGVRGNATFLNFSHDFDSDDLEYGGKLKLRSGGIMVDAYPFGGGFRISAGARINGNKGRVVARPIDDTVTINGVEYAVPPDGNVRGNAETKDFVPALTLGYGGTNRSGFLFGIEAGALFQGKVRIRDFTTNIPGVTAADLEAERLSIQDDVDDYKVYPIVQITLGYRF